MLSLSIAPTRTRTVAAARLTSAYTASVLLLLAPLLGVVGSMAIVPAFLPFPIAVWFAVTFLLLAFVRRAAFIALWLLMLAAWWWQIEHHMTIPSATGGEFALWSVLAAPLYAITAIGFGAVRRMTRLRRVAWTAGIAGWAGLLALAARFPFGFFQGCVMDVTTGMPPLDTAIETAWLAVPPLVALDAIRRVCQRSGMPAPLTEE